MRSYVFKVLPFHSLFPRFNERSRKIVLGEYTQGFTFATTLDGGNQLFKIFFFITILKTKLRINHTFQWSF